MFVIEDNVPVPPKKADSISHALKSLKPTQSIFFELEDTKKSRSPLSGLVSFVQKRYGGKYTTRVVEGGIRIWRIE